MIELIDKYKAIQILWDLIDNHLIGSEKGSSEHWFDLMFEYGYGLNDDDGFEQQPSLLELFIAAGFSKDDILKSIHLNPDCIPEKMIESYKNRG